MRTLIVDWREERAQALKELCERKGSMVEVRAVGSGRGPLPDVDLVLVHVGESQEDEGGDDIAALLQHYGPSTWTLCYSGGEPVPAASQCPLAYVAVFPTRVSLDAPGQPLVDMVSRVLEAVPGMPNLPGRHFRTLVSGHDEVLEAKLDFLGWLLGGPEASATSVEALTATYSADLASVGTTRPSDISTVRALRDRFFGG